MQKTITHLLSLIRFSHTIFALPFALLAAMMAWNEDGFRWQELLGILLCMVTARSAAMAFNRLVDRKIDAQNPRTAQRHLPAGILSVWPGHHLRPRVRLSPSSPARCSVPAQPIAPLPLAPRANAFLCGYSYTKRFTSLAHFWLGAALAMSPIAAWIAIRGEQVLQHPGRLTPRASPRRRSRRLGRRIRHHLRLPRFPV